MTHLGTEPPAAPRTLLERLLGDTEPVRRALYPVLVAVVALLVFYGRLDAGSVPLWLALAVAALGIGGTEAARAVAYSPATVGVVAEDEFARGKLVARYESYGEHDPNRCREVEDGYRCALGRGHAGPHKMT